MEDPSKRLFCELVRSRSEEWRTPLCVLRARVARLRAAHPGGQTNAPPANIQNAPGRPAAALGGPANQWQEQPGPVRLPLVDLLV